MSVGELASTSIDCPDPSTLATFYSVLLGFQRIIDRPDGSLEPDRAPVLPDSVQVLTGRLIAELSGRGFVR